MNITINSVACDVPDGATLAETAAQLSPYGREPVILLLNGVRTEANAKISLRPGDELSVYPLLIGG